VELLGDGEHQRVVSVLALGLRLCSPNMLALGSSGMDPA
jgi:hypothetical protein